MAHISPQTYKKVKQEISPVIESMKNKLYETTDNIIEALRKGGRVKDYTDYIIAKVVTKMRKEEGVVMVNQFPRGRVTPREEQDLIFPELEVVDQYFEDFDEGWYKIRKPLELPGKPMKIGILSDIHIANHVRPSLMIALQEIKRQGCDTVILNGDVMDCESLGFWRKRPDKNLWAMEREYGRNFLTGLRKMFPKERIIWKDGNHELRIQTDIIDKNPALYGVVTIQNEMELAKHGIEYVEDKQVIKCGELTIIHGHEVRMTSNVVNVARTMFLKTQVNVLFGHFHVGQEYDSSDFYKRVRGAWAVGCLCDLSPDYNPYANNWRHGFAIVEKEASGLFTVFNKKIIESEIR